MAHALRILIVEDEWLIAEDHADRVRTAGHEVVGPVPTVRAAIGQIESGRPDAALLDVQLNGETSYALADMLRERAIPFAFLTGYGGDALPPRFAGVRVLQKPTKGTELADAVLVLAGRNGDG